MFRKSRDTNPAPLLDVFQEAELVEEPFVPVDDRGRVNIMATVAGVILFAIMILIVLVAKDATNNVVRAGAYFTGLVLICLGIYWMVSASTSKRALQPRTADEAEIPEFSDDELAPAIAGDYLIEDEDTTPEEDSLLIIRVVLECALILPAGMFVIWILFSWTKDLANKVFGLGQFFTYWVLVVMFIVWIALVVWSTYMSILMARKRRPNVMKQQVPVDWGELVKISEKDLYKLRHKLNIDRNMPHASETRIRGATRKSPAGFLGRKLRVPIGLLIAYGLLLNGMTAQYDVPDILTFWVYGLLGLWCLIEFIREKMPRGDEAEKPHPRLRTRLTAPLMLAVIYSAWLFGSTVQYPELTETTAGRRLSILFVAGLIIWSLNNIQAWHDWYMLITNKSVIMIRMPSPLFWWRAEGSTVRFLFTKVNISPERQQGAWGNIRGYGALVVGVLGTEDDPYNRLEHIPDHENYSMLINMEAANTEG